VEEFEPQLVDIVVAPLQLALEQQQQPGCIVVVGSDRKVAGCMAVVSCTAEDCWGHKDKVAVGKAVADKAAAGKVVVDKVELQELALVSLVLRRQLAQLLLVAESHKPLSFLDRCQV
jgi:hypothetical protein